MKVFAVIMIVLLLAAVCAVGYLYFSADLTVRFESCVATDGVTQADYFDQLKSQVESKTFVGTLYSSEPLASADQYQFLTYTVTVQNRSFLTADIVELRLTSKDEDVLLLGDLQQHTVPAGKTDTLTATILTSRDTRTSVREGIVTWYFWGKEFKTVINLQE